MTIQYKNQAFSLVGTVLTTVLTINVSSVAIVKSAYVTNNDASSAILVNADMRDTSGTTDYEFFREDVAAKSQTNMTPEGLNLEAGDVIKVQAGTGGKVEGVISYALINRENENG